MDGSDGCQPEHSLVKEKREQSITVVTSIVLQCDGATREKKDKETERDRDREVA